MKRLTLVLLSLLSLAITACGSEQADLGQIGKAVTTYDGGGITPPPVYDGGGITPPPTYDGGGITPPPTYDGGGVTPPPTYDGGGITPPDAGACKKVKICHIPQGNVCQAKTLELCLADVKGHLKHGDLPFPCPTHLFNLVCKPKKGK